VNGLVAQVRTLLVLTVTAVAALPLAAVARPPLTTVLTGLESPPATPSLEEALTALCAAALVACYAAWVLGVLLTVLDALLSGAPREAVRRVPCPRLARVLAVSVLGASLAVSSPASADPPHDARRAAPPGTGPSHVLAGLPLPDRIATGTVSTARVVTTPPPTRRHEVSRGDTLWAVATRALPPEAPEAAVDLAWRRIAAANRDVVGDPDLIFPGTVLRVPPLDELLGEDHT
jgi:nucleoid-associated protein YgaU